MKLGEGGIGGTTVFQSSVLLKQRSSLKAQQESQDTHATLLEQLTTYLALSLPDADTYTILFMAKHEAALTCRRAQVIVNAKIPCVASTFIHVRTCKSFQQSSQLYELGNTISQKITPKDGPFFS